MQINKRKEKGEGRRYIEKMKKEQSINETIVNKLFSLLLNQHLCISCGAKVHTMSGVLQKFF